MIQLGASIMLSFMFGSASPAGTLNVTGASVDNSVAMICLVIIVGIYVTLVASKYWSDNLSLSLKLAIWPLAIIFISVAAITIMDFLIFT